MTVSTETAETIYQTLSFAFGMLWYIFLAFCLIELASAALDRIDWVKFWLRFAWRARIYFEHAASIVIRLHYRATRKAHFFAGPGIWSTPARAANRKRRPEGRRACRPACFSLSANEEEVA